ncbi:MAG TPA: hypothetical protein VJ844_03270 [Mucilaginibacter sp.]|nr:hypothetical protein [Mucilaginibacter sp.]
MTNDPLTNDPMTNNLTALLESLKTDIIHSLQAKGKYTTGQTAQQITVTAEADTAQLNLPAYLLTLETGRRPTGQNATQSVPPMIERIQDWCKAKGIPDKAAWAIKKSIDKHGYKGSAGVLSEPLSDGNINLRLTPVAEKIADALVQQIAVAVDSDQ